MSVQWRCFHCDFVTRSYHAAKAHFGPSEMAKPACQFDAKELREMEEELAKYRAEDTDLHRQIANLQGMMADAIRKAEEQGYDRGVRDCHKLHGVLDTMIEGKS